MKAINVHKIFKGLKLLGWFIAILSIYILGIKLFQINTTGGIQHIQIHTIIILATLLSFLYALSMCALPYAWKFLLLAEEKDVKLVDSIIAYGSCQLSKYNLFRLRQFKHKQYCAEVFGITAKTLFDTTIWEVSLISIAGGLLSAYLLIAGAPSSISLFTLLLVTILIIIATPSIIRLIEVMRFKSLLSYLVYHLISGLIFATVLYFLVGFNLSYSHLLIAIGGYTLAWVAGFIIPGAPNGIGVRELTLFFILSPWFSEFPLLLSIVITRLINFSGEFILYIFTNHFIRRNNKVQFESNA